MTCSNRGALVNYCKKKESQAPETTFIEFGMGVGLGRQGFRSDLAGVQDIMESGGSLKDIVKAYPSVYMKYSNGIEKALDFFDAPTEFRKRKIYLLHGKTNQGKTKFVFDAYGYKDIYKWNSTGKWFDGYNGQEVMLCDDVRWECDKDGRKSFLNGRTCSWWLNFLDGYPVKVEVKGSTRWMISTTLFLTTNQDPATWWSNYPAAEAADPFFRRVDHVYKV